MLYLILSLIFLSVSFAGVAVWMLVVNRDSTSKRVRQRLQGVRKVEDYNLGESLASAEDQKREKKKEKRKAVKQRALGNVPILEKKFGHRPWVERLNSRLRQAQLPISVTSFLMICGGCALLGGLLTVVWYAGLHPAVTPLTMLAFGAGPYIYLLITVAQRIKRFNLQFPDALDLLSSSVKSGQSLNNAIQNVADEMPEPVSEEFGIMADEMTFGEEPGSVLKNFQHRMGTEDVQVFCTALQIQRETGGNLSEVLDGLQKTIRERFRILRQVKTLTAQGRLSGWIVGILPIGLGAVLYFCNPEYIGLLFTTTTGNYLLIAAGVLQLIGMLLIRKIVNIKV
jgi:tight adherence protein B